MTLYSISNSSHSLGLNTLSVNTFRHGMFPIVITPMPASSLAHSVTNCNFFPEYDGVPIIVIGNLKGQKKNMLHYQIPAGVMEDSTCEHFYIDLPDSAQCKRVFDKTIEKCYNSSCRVKAGPHQPFFHPSRTDESTADVSQPLTQKTVSPRIAFIFTYTSSPFLIGR